MAVTETELAAAIAAAVAASKGNATWQPVLVTGLITGAVAFGSLIANHWLTRWRDRENLKNKTEIEKQAEDARNLTVRRFICSELIFYLESFALRCHNEMFESTISVKDPSTWPQFSLEMINRDWSVLPHDILYALQELPVAYRAALQENAYMVENHVPLLTIDALKSPHASAGVKAARMAIRLREEYGFPDSPLTGNLFSVYKTLQEQHDICVSYLNSGADYLMHPTTATIIPDDSDRTSPPAKVLG